MTRLLAAWALSLSLLIGCASVDPNVVRDIATRRAITTGLLELASEVTEAGGVIESMRRGTGSATFRVLVEPSKAPAVASTLQSADNLGMGAIQQKTDPATGKTVIIAGARLNPHQASSQLSFVPAAVGEWEKQLEIANSIAMQHRLYFWRFFPVSTESEKSLSRVHIEVIVSGTPENLKRWAQEMHARAGSSLVLDDISLEHRAGDPRGVRLTGDLFVYRR